LQKNKWHILISSLSRHYGSTAKRLSEGSYYAWGHHGACNCGSLLQVITSMTKEEILRYAHTGTGEWTEIAEEYCLITGAPVYLMLSKLEALD